MKTLRSWVVAAVLGLGLGSAVQVARADMCGGGGIPDDKPDSGAPDGGGQGSVTKHPGHARQLAGGLVIAVGLGAIWLVNRRRG